MQDETVLLLNTSFYIDLERLNDHKLGKAGYHQERYSYLKQLLEAPEEDAQYIM